MSGDAPSQGASLRAAAWGAAVGAPLAYALGILFLHLTRASESAATGPTAATLDEAFNTLLGAGLGIALGGAVGARLVRRWLPFIAVWEAALACAAIDVVLFTDGALAGRDDLITAAMLVIPAIGFAILGYALGLGTWQIWRRTSRVIGRP